VADDGEGHGHLIFVQCFIQYQANVVFFHIWWCIMVTTS